MKISPWFLALILVFSIAAYALLGSTRIIELFTLRSDKAACESSYQKCLAAGTNKVTCTTQYTKCNLDLASPGNYEVLLAASVLKNAQAACEESSKQKCLAVGANATACTEQYNKCAINVAGNYDTSGNYQALKKAFDASGNRPHNPNISPPPGCNTTVPNSKVTCSSSWPWAPSTTVSVPDIASAWKILTTAWDKSIPGTTPDMLTAAGYTSHCNSVPPTYIPRPRQPTLTALVPTDAGTGAEAILAGSTLTPSLRQMIRNDIAATVQNEFDDIHSRYQIQYNYE